MHIIYMYFARYYTGKKMSRIKNDQNNTGSAVRIMMALLLSFTLFFAMSASVFAEEGSQEAQEEAVRGAADFGDFSISYDDSKYSEPPCTFADGVLTINGDVTVSMKESGGDTTQRIVVASDADVTIDGVTIYAKTGPAVKINAGVKSTLTLEGDNNVKGAPNYAAVDVGWELDNLAELTINGDGSIKAVGGNASAGIGGSYANKTSEGTGTCSYCGNIIIDGGTIDATGTNGGAGIGSGNNNGLDADGGSHSRSFKMLTTSASSGGVEPEIGSITINGGNITAFAGVGAGIGGGNHVDSGKITINGGTIESAKSNDGAGIGSGRGSSNYGGDADKGHGYYYADVTINGGTIKEAIGGWLSAGIGGGYECDAIVTINGGTIEKAVGGDGNTDSYYQGAPGIGAGYQGNVQFTMNGGTVKYAKGGWSAPGIGYGAGIQDYGSKRKPDGEHVSAEDSLIRITDGTIELAEGGMYAAGIGGGNGCPVCNIEITGGNILAKGYSDPDDLTAGGAGIGSGVGKDSGLKYSRDTKETISITGGNVVSIGGWGASGIGSGAVNPGADSITIDASKANIEAYADGTKFAIDTRNLKPDGSTESITEGRDITGDLLQGTFVHAYVSEDGVRQGTEGLASIVVINDSTDKEIELTGMKDYGLSGYRSFATTVDGAGTYTVYTADKAVAKGGGRFFNKCTDDVRTEEDVRTAQDIEERNVQYTVRSGELCDNFYLFPVKSIVVTKEVEAEEEVKQGLDHTLKFALWSGGSDGHYVVDPDSDTDERWEQTIQVKNGVPERKAYFINVDEGTYGVWELDENGNDMKPGTPVPGNESVTLVAIRTVHGDTEDNDATIGPEVDTDYVTVINTYEKSNDPGGEDPKDPDDPEDPSGDKEKKSGTKTVDPKTGDETELVLYSVLFTAAAMMLALTGAIRIFLRKKGGRIS